MSTTRNTTKRQIVFITTDEKIIEQIQNNDNMVSLKTIIFDAANNINEQMDVSRIDDKKSPNREKVMDDSLICVVCGSSANGRNFGAIACESCKLFFRRNALKPSKVRCNRKNACEITVQTRRRCPACRLAKCLKNGMKREGLLRAEEKATKRHKTDSQNVTYKTPSSLPISSKSASKSQQQQLVLSPHDLESIENVRIAYEKRIELAARDGLPWDPSISVTTPTQTVNSRVVPAMRLLAFFKQIPEFKELNADDKLVLAKYNIMPLLLLNCSLSFNINTRQIREAETDVPYNLPLVRSMHGPERFMEMRNIFESYVQIGLYNPRIVQIALIILILTKGLSAADGEPEPILNDSMAVYRAQNYYLELLWKYMEVTHGYEQAFRLFNTLITRVLSWQLLERELRYNIGQMTSVSEENQLLPLMKSFIHAS